MYVSITHFFYEGKFYFIKQMKQYPAFYISRGMGPELLQWFILWDTLCFLHNNHTPRHIIKQNMILTPITYMGGSKINNTICC
jgi:hypothetical protein